jgi:hypothetical protein
MEYNYMTSTAINSRRASIYRTVSGFLRENEITSRRYYSDERTDTTHPSSISGHAMRWYGLYGSSLNGYPRGNTHQVLTRLNRKLRPFKVKAEIHAARSQYGYSSLTLQIFKK